MFCTKCGKQLDSAARFCSACGAPVAKPIAEETPEAVTVAETATETNIPEATETTKVAENTTEANTPETPATAEIAKTATEADIPEVPETTEVAENTTTVDTPETPKTAEIAKTATETDTPEATEAAEVAETATPTETGATPATAEIVENVVVAQAAEVVVAVQAEEGAKEAGTDKSPAPSAGESADTAKPSVSPAPSAAETNAAPKAEEGIAAEPLPAPIFSEFAKESPSPKKKKKKAAPLIAGGVAVVVAGTAAVGWFGFRNQVLRLFLGDAGFAVRIEKKTGEFLSFGEGASSALTEAFAARIDEAIPLLKEESADEIVFEEYEDAQIAETIAELRAIVERFGGSEVAFGLSIEPDVLLNSLLGQSGEVTELLETVGKFQGVLRAESDGNADRVEFSAEYEGDEIVGGAVTLDPNKLIMTVPALSGYTFFTEYAAAGETASVTVSAEELGRLGEAIAALYYKAYAEAALTYEDGSFAVAGRTVEGTRIRAELSAEQMNALYQRITDMIQNDEYLREFYRTAVGEDGREYDELFTEPIVFSAPFVAESYIAANETLLAKTYSFAIAEDEEDRDEDGEKDPVTFAYARPDENDSLRVGLPDGKRFGFDRLANAETEEDDGTIELLYTGSTEEDAPTLVLALDYVGSGTAEINGEPIALGTYTLHLSEKDTMLRSLLLGSSAAVKTADPSEYEEKEPSGTLAILDTILERFTLTVSVKALDAAGGAIRTDLTLSLGDYLSVSAYLEQKPLEGAGEPIAIPSTEGEKAINIKEGADEATASAVRIDYYENLLRRIDENSSFAKLAEKLELKEAIEEALAEEREKLEFMTHYANYSDYTRFSADPAAWNIRNEFVSDYWDILLALNEDGSENEKWGTEEFTKTIHLYFDKDGEMTVLDDGGLGYFLDFSELTFDEDRKNLYCEILFSAYGEQPNGVTVVYTDDPSDLPKNLPTAYHYIDEVYEWDGKDNAIGAYIVGTSPILAEGVSTAEERLRQEREERAKEREALDALNDAAKRLNSAVNGFLRTNPSFFHPDISIASAIVRYDADAGWVVDSLTGNDGELTGASDLFPGGTSAVGQLAEHLNRRFPDFTPVKAQIHFAREYNTERGESEDMTAIGTAVIAADAHALFQDGGLPWALAFWLGYESGWNGNNPSADPEAGYYWLDRDSYLLLGSYCAETDAPLGVEAYENDEDIFDHEIETLDEYARRIAAVAAPYAAEHTLVEEGQVLYSLVLTNQNGRWRFENAYTNNYRLSDGDGVDRAAIAGLVNELNERTADGRLGIAREITAELHFFDGEGFVGVGTAFVTSDLDVTDVHVPGAWDYKNGYFYDWNALRRAEENRPGVYYKDNYTAIPFGSYCAVSDAPLGLYEPRERGSGAE
ncbi:MAG: zinc-ribbon domain-containing protein [Bacteroides sp.]|nr:zinc-ribbon domain-containing protein [Eubacterium sp.]MCM1418548.1 zinc-ribbon domain-containing protein [Roseburia sp.]MCM1462570.1 zinc-ribbon domain-containing protein [Bacteroides sp.]